MFKFTFNISEAIELFMSPKHLSQIEGLSQFMYELHTSQIELERFIFSSL